VRIIFYLPFKQETVLVNIIMVSSPKECWAARIEYIADYLWPIMYVKSNDVNYSDYCDCFIRVTDCSTIRVS